VAGQDYDLVLSVGMLAPKVFCMDEKEESIPYKAFPFGLYYAVGAGCGLQD